MKNNISHTTFKTDEIEQSVDAASELRNKKPHAKKRFARKYRFRRRSTGMTVLLWAGAVLVTALISTVLFVMCDIHSAKKQFDSGEYAEAKVIFERYEFVPYAERMCDACEYAAAEQMIGRGEYLSAYELFASIIDYEDSAERADAALYSRAEELFEIGEYDEAIEIYVSLINYKDSVKRIDECMIAKGIELYHRGEYDQALAMLSNYAGDYELADVYVNLSELYQRKQLNDWSETRLNELLNNLLQYEHIEEAAEALKDPLFFFQRYKDCQWVCGRYFINCVDIEKIVYNIPSDWGLPENKRILKLEVTELTEDGSGLNLFLLAEADFPSGEEQQEPLYVSLDDGQIYNKLKWFTITGFDSYEKIHPDTMYVLGNDGFAYIFERSDDSVIEQS